MPLTKEERFKRKKERQKVYRDKNKELIAQKYKIWREANKDRLNKRSREYRINNPEKVKAYQREYQRAYYYAKKQGKNNESTS